MHSFIRAHIEEFVRLHPRNEPLETPIDDPVRETIHHGDYSWNRTKIKVIDNNSNTG